MGGFDTATAVVPVDAAPADATTRAWSADIPATWNVPIGVHGGMLLATSLRGAVAALDAHHEHDQVLRSAHCSFLARPDDGRLALTTTVVRTGRTTSHVDVTARHPQGEIDLIGTRALFARRRDVGGAGFLDATMPDVAGPGDLVPETGWDADSGGPLLRPPLFDQLDLRPALGVLPWEDGWRPGLPAEYARWNRYLTPPRLPDGTFDPLALLPLADLPGPAVWVHFGPDEPFYFLTSLELTAHFVEPVTDEWILTDFRARWLGEGYVITECDVWSAGRLVAQVNQMMLVRPGPTRARPTG